MESVTEQLVEAKKYYDRKDFKQALSMLHAIEKDVPYTTETPCIERKIFHLLGLIYYKQGNPAKAEHYFLEALNRAVHCESDELLCNSYDNLSAVYLTLNRTYPAMEYLQKSIALKEKSNREEDMSSALIQLASLHLSIGNVEAGEKAIARSRILITKYKQKFFLMHWYFANATLLDRKKQHDLALKNYRLAAQQARQHKEPYIESRAYFNRGDLLDRKRRFKEAELAYKKALAIAHSNGLVMDEWQAKCNLAGARLAQGDLGTAHRILQELQSADDAMLNDQLRYDIEGLAAKVYEKEKNYAAALHQQKKRFQAYKKLYNKEINQTVLDTEAKYENEKKIRELKEARLREAESELKALRSQMNPHFIFNAIGSMRHSLLLGSVEETDRLMVRFSRLLRLILDTSHKPTMLLTENIELLELYIQVEQTRHEGGLDYRIDVDKSLQALSIKIPGLILQPLVENAILHGLFHKTSGTKKLRISFRKKGKAIAVKITDNGVGREQATKFRKSGHTSHATALIQETLKLLWKQDDVAKYFVIRDLVGKDGRAAGTSVQVLIPIDYMS